MLSNQYTLVFVPSLSSKSTSIECWFWPEAAALLRRLLLGCRQSCPRAYRKTSPGCEKHQKSENQSSYVEISSYNHTVSHYGSHLKQKVLAAGKIWKKEKNHLLMFGKVALASW